MAASNWSDALRRRSRRSGPVGPLRARSGSRVAYDGAGFHGLRPQPRRAHGRWGTLGEALATVAAAAGRADRRRAHRRRRPRLGPGRLRRPAGRDRPRRPRRAPQQAAAPRRSSCATRRGSDDDFDARFSATWRHYRYDVWNDADAEPVPGRPGVARARSRWPRWAMQAACDPLIGEHDFTSFCRPPPHRSPTASAEPSLVRRVLSARWTELDDARHLRFEIRATAFCHQMVRSIVGTLVDVGIGQDLAGRRPRHPRRPRPRRRRPGRPALRAGAVGGRLPAPAA